MSPAVPQVAERAHEAQVRSGERFTFGANWARFLAHLDDGRIAVAERSLKDWLEVDRLDGVRFLDAGSGSGLFSLVARRLGARVTSFDFDPQSVACTRELRARYFRDDPDWQVLEGSVLDRAFLESLGQFDVVYSWGVLHHTGQMWAAVDNVAALVGPGGRFFTAIYNDQGKRSDLWRAVKKAYCSGRPGRAAVIAVCVPHLMASRVVSDLARLRNPMTFYRRYAEHRGMSVWRDWIDWLGGYPFEVASAHAVFDFLRERGFRLDRLFAQNGSGCNQYVLTRMGAAREGTPSR